MIRVAPAALGLVLVSACGHSSGVERHAEADGTYRIDCRQPLQRCLGSLEEVCSQGYEILRAREEKRFYGPNEINEPSLTSYAVARCTSPASLFGKSDKDGEKQAEATTASSAPRTPVDGGPMSGGHTKNCVPGSTQACVGPGACQGGQQCLGDGTAFGPCDCGGAGPVSPPPPPGLSPANQ